MLFIAFSATEINAQSKKMDAFTLQVDGLGCPFCAFGLEKKFKEFKGIKDVKIEIETGVFTFNYPTDKNLSLVDVTKQVEKAGYTPMSVKIERADGKIETDEVKNEVSSKEKEMITTSVFVAGNCGMCKARIEKAAKINGVSSATWDKDSKQLVLEFNTKTVSQNDIEKAVAKAGHDTKNHSAKKDTYNDLPGCCHYERVQ